MVERLPRRLSPRAKYRLARAGADERVRTLVTVAPPTASDTLLDGVTALGGAVQSWDRETGLITIDLPAAQLGRLAELSGVVQVDADDRYQP